MITKLMNLIYRFTSHIPPTRTAKEVLEKEVESRELVLKEMGNDSNIRPYPRGD